MDLCDMIPTISMYDTLSLWTDVFDCALIMPDIYNCMIEACENLTYGAG